MRLEIIKGIRGDLCVTMNGLWIGGSKTSTVGTAVMVFDVEPKDIKEALERIEKLTGMAGEVLSTDEEI